MAKKISLFREHLRIREYGAMVNPHTGEVTTPPSMTKQEFKKECDINNVIKSYSQTGMVSHISAKAQMGAYQDLPDSLDFQDSLHIIKQAETAFMSLPAKTRERFNNEPAQFLAFVNDPKNGDELIKLGLRTPPPVVSSPAPPAPNAPSVPTPVPETK